MLLVHAPTRQDAWHQAFAAALDGMPVVAAGDETADKAAIRYIATRNPPAGLFDGLSGLNAIFLLSAGAEGLAALPRPPLLPVYRILDGGMAAQMLEYCLYGVLHFHRGMDRYRQAQAERRWRPSAPVPSAQTRIGMLGLGVMGRTVAGELSRLGFTVHGWSRTLRRIDGIATYAGREGLAQLAAQANILINLLPLTSETAGILNADIFGGMPRDSALISVGRGAHLDEPALLQALDAGQLRGALLDVFQDEPLPAASPLWTHPGILVTPHIAAWTRMEPAVAQIVRAIATIEAGGDPPGRVDDTRGY